MEFRSDCWKSSGERIFGRNFSTSAKWTSISLMRSMPRPRLPFVSFRTDPPNWPSVVFLNIIRRDVSIFGGMSLRREQRMRFGERHKRLLPVRRCPDLIHGPPCYRRRPSVANQTPRAPSGRNIFLECCPKVVALLQPWANICQPYRLSISVNSCNSCQNFAFPAYLRLKPSVFIRVHPWLNREVVDATQGSG